MGKLNNYGTVPELDNLTAYLVPPESRPDRFPSLTIFKMVI